MPPAPRLFLAAILAFGLVPSTFAQEEGGEGRPQEYRAAYPGFTAEFAFSDESLWFGLTSHFRRANGHTAVGWLNTREDDNAVSVRLMRYGRPSAGPPIYLGLGLGGFAALVDEPDAELFSLSITGAAAYELALAYPVRISAEVSFSPELATFSDGEGMLDLIGRVELQVSSWASAFVGYRHLEVELEDTGDEELDSTFHLGLRLGF